MDTGMEQRTNCLHFCKVAKFFSFKGGKRDERELSLLFIQISFCGVGIIA